MRISARSKSCGRQHVKATLWGHGLGQKQREALSAGVDRDSKNIQAVDKRGGFGA